MERRKRWEKTNNQEINVKIATKQKERRQRSQRKKTAKTNKEKHEVKEINHLEID